MTTPAARALLTDLFDYAGLFPPSKLPMDEAVRNYAAYRESSHAWMLSRMVVPVGRLGEFDAAADELLPRDGDTMNGDGADGDVEEPASPAMAGARPKPWKLAGLIAPDKPLGKQIDAIFAFNSKHEEDPDAGLAEIDTIELKGGTPGEIDKAMETIPEQLTPFFELDHRADIRGHLAALAGSGGSAKVRCGGVTPELFPTAEQVAAFVHACAAAEVPFKCTAGLHHPIRNEHALTYEDESPRGVMHGFLNVFTAAVLAERKRLGVDELTRCLEERDPKAFRFEGSALSWAGHSVDAERIERARFTFAISIGSCSFTEPIDDLNGLGVLDERLRV